LPSAGIIATPNPFRQRVTLTYTVPSGFAGAPVTLEIWDPQGRLVRHFGRRSGGTGPPVFVWDGDDALGRPVAGGVYFGVLRLGELAIPQRLVRLR
jgi:hypothetical protein